MTWQPINEIMPINVTGIVTARDHFVVDFDKDSLLQRMTVLRDKSVDDDSIRQAFFAGKGSSKYPPGDSRGWKLPDARRKLRSDSEWRERCIPILYRPFDEREIYYVPWMVDWPRSEAMPHMLKGDNVALITCRQQSRTDDEWAQVGLSRNIMDHSAISNVTREINYTFPLYLYPGVGNSDLQLFAELGHDETDRLPNFDPKFVRAIEASTDLSFSARLDEHHFTSKQVFAYIYSVFHSPRYRKRFDPMLKRDFPRVPLPGNRGVFEDLAHVGDELLALHTMQSRKLYSSTTVFTGPEDPEVGRVGWSQDTVWLDAGKTNAREGHTASVPGAIGFEGVSREAWDFRMGAYQVLHKWLKDRRGRTLSEDDITHYQKVVVVIDETIRIMGEIDEIIDGHGGWPDAFTSSGG